MHDSQVEDRLRGLLRAEGDGLSLTVTTAELERRLHARRRAARGRRASFMAAAIAFVAVGAIVAAGNGWISFPAGIVGASPSPSSPPSSPATLPTASPSTGQEPSRQPLGRPDRAILVRPVGDPSHPTGFVVTRVDPLTGQSILIATIPESALPQNLYLTGVPSISTTGWLAIPYNGAGNLADGSLPLVLIVDVTDPTAEPWVVDGSGQSSWNDTDQLGVTSFGGIYLDDPATRRQSFITTPDESVFTQIGHRGSIVWSTEPGTLSLARRGTAAKPDWGSIDIGGTFIQGTDLPAAYQRTGLERPTGVAAHIVGQPCNSFGIASPSDCSLIETDASSTAVATRLDDHDARSMFGHVWAADGSGLWLLMDGGSADGRSAVTLDYSRAGDGRNQIARIVLPPNDSGPAILGITSETEPGSALLAVGSDTGLVWAFVAPGGAVTSQDGSAWFAGWAGDQPAYDPD